jgi:HD-GYP domain-containing protein (c-di-GMP phosphodiesterase class II)
MLRHVVAGHHELLDGSGYPFGLQGEQIRLEARIVAVADIYDALTQVRVYKPALDPAEAEEILQGMAAAGRLDRRRLCGFVKGVPHPVCSQEHGSGVMVVCCA